MICEWIKAIYKWSGLDREGGGTHSEMFHIIGGLSAHLHIDWVSQSRGGPRYVSPDMIIKIFGKPLQAHSGEQVERNDLICQTLLGVAFKKKIKSKKEKKKNRGNNIVLADEKAHAGLWAKGFFSKSD